MKPPRTLRDWLNIIGCMVAVYLFVATCQGLRNMADPIVRQLIYIKAFLCILVLGQIHQRLSP